MPEKGFVLRFAEGLGLGAWCRFSGAKLRNVFVWGAGHDTSAAVTDGGDALVWGMGTNYQLARGENENDANVPYKVKREKIGNGVAKVLQVAFGGQHTLLLAKP